jgi:hypothetical protein
METLLAEQPQSMTDSVPETGKITFVAYNPKTQMPVVCRPLTDQSGKLWTGQGQHGYYDLLSAEEKAKLAFIFDYDTSVRIEDGKVLDLDDPYDKAVWKWLRKHPYIALDRRSGEGNRDAVFYVANAVKEAKERIDKTAKIDEARPAVRKLSQADQVRVAKALGLDGAAGFTPEQVLDWLLSYSNTHPETVLATIDPGNKSRLNAKVALKEFIKYEAIKREKDGAFYFGGIDGVNLGHTEEMVVDYLLNPENSERVKSIKAKFAEISKQPA